MRIVNPLYDQAFKYLMENEPLARKILSIIIEENIVSLQMKPQESIYADKERGVFGSRFDFKAVVRTAEGDMKTILIELQKSKSPDPVNRFRKYLGKNYLKQEAFVNESGIEESRPLPIVTIYILGHSLPEYDSPGILVNNVVYDAVTKQKIDTKSDFVSLLTHPSYILQVENLKAVRKTKLEKFLSLFDQSYKTDDKYILDVPEEEMEGLEDVIAYLNRATQDEDIINNLEFEEDIEDEFVKKENLLKEALKKVEAERKIAEAERKKAEEERKNAEVKDRMLEEERKKLLDAAHFMKQSGISVPQITTITGLSEEIISNL